MNMGSEEKLYLATGVEWNSPLSFIWLVFIICCSALPWQTVERLEMISVVHCILLPPQVMYMIECISRGLYLLPKSSFLVVFTFEHQPHRAWLQYSVSLIGRGYCCSHTCDADTARKELGCPCESRAPTPTLPTLGPHSTPSLPSGCFSFTKASRKPQKNAAAHCELLNP